MVVLLAVLAALLFALAAAAEQRAASRLMRPPTAVRCAAAGCPGTRRPLSRAERAERKLRQALRLAGRFARSPLWIAGWLADALGFGTQAGALHVGSLSIVQPLLVTTLLFSLPLAALGSRRAPRWPEWAGGVAACAGLALVLSGRREAGPAAVHGHRLLLMALFVAAIAAVLVALGSRARAPRGRAVVLAVAAGMMFAEDATLVKLVTGSLAHSGVAGTAAYWPAYALAAVSAVGLALQQAAFSAGSLAATMAAITITDPLLSYGFGVVGFGEHPPRGLAAGGLAVLGLLLLGTGVVVLARSPLLRAPAAPPAPPAAPAVSQVPAIGEPAAVADLAALGLAVPGSAALGPAGLAGRAALTPEGRSTPEGRGTPEDAVLSPGGDMPGDGHHHPRGCTSAKRQPAHPRSRAEARPAARRPDHPHHPARCGPLP